MVFKCQSAHALHCIREQRQVRVKFRKHSLSSVTQVFQGLPLEFQMGAR